MRSIVREIVTAQADRTDWRGRLAATFDSFIGGLQQDYRAARILLVEAYAAGPAAVAQVRRAERTFEARIADCFPSAGDFAISQPLARAMVSGMIGLSRSRLEKSDGESLSGLSGELTAWALSLCHDSAAEIMDLDCPGLEGTLTHGELRTSVNMPRGGEPVGDRALILDAVAKLALTGGYEGLTVPSVCMAAGISRRRFHRQYADVKECFVDAAEARLREAFAEAESTMAEGGASDRPVQIALSALCQAIARDRTLRRIGFAEVLYPGVSGLAVRDRTVARLRDLIVPPGADPLAEASAAAMWDLLTHLIAEGGHWHPARVGRTLTFLALAPTAAADLPGPAG